MTETMYAYQALRREGLDVRLGLVQGHRDKHPFLVVSIKKFDPSALELYDRNGAAIVRQVNDRPRPALVDDGDGLRLDLDALDGDGGESRPELLDEGAVVVGHVRE